MSASQGLEVMAKLPDAQQPERIQVGASLTGVFHEVSSYCLSGRSIVDALGYALGDCMERVSGSHGAAVG
jgi:hypothetical protein